MNIINGLKLFSIALAVAAPSYLVAYLTNQMVYVVPTLAATLFFVSSIRSESNQKTRVDEDGPGDAG
jgi:hypothetical protein